MLENEPGEKEKIQKLRAEWRWAVAFSAAAFLVTFLILRASWEQVYAWAWLVITTAVAAYQFAFLWQQLPENRLHSGKGGLFADLGLANRITILRALLTGAMAGFLPGPWPAGWLAWLPGGLYLIAALLDFVDGYAARVTGRTTRLGEALDMQWDGAGVLIGAALAARYGQVPVWFLLVGLARFLFIFGAWLRTRRGLPVYDLDPSMIRRALAGMQMGFIAVVLLPVFSPPATRVAAVLFMLPFLLHFGRDFLWVSGVLRPSAAQFAVRGPRAAGDLEGTRRALRFVLPIMLRGVLAALLLVVLVQQIDSGDISLGVMIVVGMALPGVLLGAAGRILALAVLLMSGFSLQSAPANLVYWLLLLVSTLMFISGTGKYSLWKPEEWLIHHRPGEESP